MSVDNKNTRAHSNAHDDADDADDECGYMICANKAELEALGAFDVHVAASKVMSPELKAWIDGAPGLGVLLGAYQTVVTGPGPEAQKLAGHLKSFPGLGDAEGMPFARLYLSGVLAGAMKEGISASASAQLALGEAQRKFLAHGDLKGASRAAEIMAQIDGTVGSLASGVLLSVWGLSVALKAGDLDLKPVKRLAAVLANIRHVTNVDDATMARAEAEARKGNFTTPEVLKSNPNAMH